MNTMSQPLSVDRICSGRPAGGTKCSAAVRLIGMLVGAFAAVTSCLWSLPVQADVLGHGAAAVKPGDMESGSLLLKGDSNGRYVEAPRVRTDVDISVSGPTARARVTQEFYNPTKSWVEGIYVYPLPDNSAVDTLKMVIGKRIVVGKIKPRQEAKVIYETAKAAGKKASLVEQERPNVFTNSVANIGPGETVVVQIEYQEPVRQSDDVYSLRVPLVVAPRYNPEPLRQTAKIDDGDGWGSASNDPVPDRDRITSPVLDPRIHAPVNPVTVSVRLNPGFLLGDVESRTHEIDVKVSGSDTRVVTLKRPVPADRDFELTWKPAASKAPGVGLFKEQVEGKDYVLAYITPPTVRDAAPKLNREIIFVIDNSGSMGGSSIRQAKASLDYALAHLKTGDRFNVIRFDDTMTQLFEHARSADAENVGVARKFVDRLEAAGGTEMLPPLKAALVDEHENDGKDVRQIVFLTDGAIGNEQQLLETIGARRGRSHIFMVGIGSAPNTYLMSRAAELGRGTFTHIASTGEVDARMRALFDKLENPAVTDLRATFTSGGADLTPENLPDLYHGGPLVLAAQMAKLSGNLTVAGKIDQRPWSVTLSLDQATVGKGISKLWARRKIDDAEVARTLRETSQQDADGRILSLALTHHLVTRLTSLVAVDETPSRPEGKPLTRAEVPLNLPAGWDFEKVFGKSVGDRTNNNEMDAAQFGGIRQSSKPIVHQSANKQVLLPQTATDAELKIMLGLMLLLLAGTCGVLVKPRRFA